MRMLVLILHLTRPSRRPCPHCIASSKPTRPSAGSAAGLGGGHLRWGPACQHHQGARRDAAAPPRAAALRRPGPVAISQRDVRAWVAELSAGPLAPATVQKAYQLLGKVMGRRTVGLPRAVVDELASHLARAGGPVDPDSFVFTAPQGGPLRVIAFRARVWRPVTRKADLHGLRIHDLRHTAVALWIAAGAGPWLLPVCCPQGKVIAGDAALYRTARYQPVAQAAGPRGAPSTAPVDKPGCAAPVASPSNRRL
jgi:hypothetical protein